MGVLLTTVVAACTPLGQWVYDDPGLQVARLRLDREATGQPPAVVVLAVWNPNDYDLSTARLELKLRLDDVPVGHFSRDSVIPVAQTGVTDLALPLTVPTGSVRERIRALSSGTHRFAVEGRATFSTPFGLRKVRFAHAGDMAFGGDSRLENDTTVTADSNVVQYPAVKPAREEGARARARRQQP